METLIIEAKYYSEKSKIFGQVAWDYKISPEELEAVLLDNKEEAGHYSRADIFKKLVESYPWFTIINVLSVESVQQLLSDELIQKLRSASLRSKYTYVKSRLQSIIPAAG